MQFCVEIKSSKNLFNWKIAPRDILWYRIFLIVYLNPPAENGTNERKHEIHHKREERSCFCEYLWHITECLKCNLRKMKNFRKTEGTTRRRGRKTQFETKLAHRRKNITERHSCISCLPLCVHRGLWCQTALLLWCLSIEKK